MNKYIDGYKVYAVCIAGIAAIVAVHFGYTLPGVQVDDKNWLENIWALLLVMTGRSAMPDKKGLI